MHGRATMKARASEVAGDLRKPTNQTPRPHGPASAWQIDHNFIYEPDKVTVSNEKPYTIKATSTRRLP